ncbi:histidine phosphatase family protein [Nodosilinea sp. LEGE 07088]|uniref:histidine phosphatase family protein n=1 Tax=Nodosilinea sp. LEGE 07088 TaxID=2777968 RepID=UPI00188203B4|nr:histidine phosphatase family protein [Nodosilinea sp. LEGE 07088]MBE9139997.1 histidine phosphatase family protein [Nodosilinea sp. LEGE 07088]
MALNLYLLRHGETEYSKSGSFCGELDPELTPEGVAMAEAFAAKYRQMPWQAIFSSPMKRTIATAMPLAQAVGVNVQLRNGLKETNYGAWEGLTAEYVREHFSDDYLYWLTEPAWNPPTGGESSVQIASRASLVMAEIEDNFTDANVLVVSHKATIRIILCSLMGMDVGRYRNRISFPVASVSMVRFDNNGPMLVKHGDRSHLPAELESRPGT